MKTIITLAVVIGIFATLELAFGINETGAKVALILLVWCCASILVSLVVGRFFEIVGYKDRED